MEETEERRANKSTDGIVSETNKPLKEHGEVIETEFTDADVDVSSEEVTLKSRIGGGEVMSPDNAYARGRSLCKGPGAGPCLAVGGTVKRPLWLEQAE